MHEEEASHLGQVSSALHPGELVLPCELAGPPPRQAPEAFYSGPLAQRRKLALQGCLIAGAICAVIAPMPFVRTLSIYLLPLGYLTWIGLAIGVIGVIAYVRAKDLRTAREYLEQGEAGFAQVVSLIKTPVLIYNGTPSQYAFVAQVELGGLSGSPKIANVTSRHFGTARKDRIHTRFRVGDWVPVVWLPGQIDSTLQIYDFLEAMPGHDLLRTGVKSRLSKLMEIVGATVAITAMFLALFWNVYAHGRYHPLNFDYPRQGLLPLLTGAAIAIVALAIGVYIYLQKRRLRNDKNIQALGAGEAIEIPATWDWKTWALMVFVATPGLFLLSSMTILCWAFTANALLDDSPAQRTPVEITQMTETTHNWILRHYEMKFRRNGDKKDSSLLTTPQHLDQFIIPQGVALIREGWLGWPWVETIEPAFAPE